MQQCLCIKTLKFLSCFANNVLFAKQLRNCKVILDIVSVNVGAIEYYQKLVHSQHHTAWHNDNKVHIAQTLQHSILHTNKYNMWVMLNYVF